MRRKALQSIALLALLLLASSIALFADDPVALTIKVKGEVNLNRSEENSKLGKGDMLMNNDELNSGDDSYAAAKFVDGSSLIKLFPNSTLKIRAEVNDENQLDKKSYLERGNIYSKIMKKAGVYEVETPTTVASVKGTEFLLSVSDTGITEVITFTGTVHMENKMDGETADVGPGMKASSGGVGPIEVESFKEEEIDGEVRDEIDELDGTADLEIELKGPDGDVRKVIIDLE